MQGNLPHAPRIDAMRLGFLLLLITPAVHLTAQGADPRTEALIVRARGGDASALSELAPIARTLLQLAGDGKTDTALTHAAARAALAMTGPLSPPEHPKTSREHQWRSTAVKALRLGVAADSGDSWSAEMLEQLAPYPYIWIRPDVELTHLRALARRRPDMPADLRLTRLRLEIERGSLDTATRLLHELPAAAASLAVRGHLAAELAFARGDDATGRSAYLAGAHAIGDSIDAGWFTRDLLWIARPAELTVWGSLSPAERGDWLEQFWERRDLADARLPGSRLPEQFRRWRIALRDYRWETDGSTAEGLPIGDLQYPGVGDDFPSDATASGIAFAGRLGPGNYIIDDRGRMILRHGEPTRTANLPGLQHDDMATWSWAGPSGQMLLGFSRPTIDSTVRMRFGMILRGRPQGDMMSICQLDGRFCALAGKVAMSRNGRAQVSVMDRVRSMAADFSRMRAQAETTDGFRETYRDELKAIAQAYGIAGGGVLVVIAVPVSKLKAEGKDRDGLYRYSARLRVVVGDTARGVIVGTLDTLRSWSLKQQPKSDAYLSSWTVVPVPTGTWQVNVVVADSARRSGTGERFGEVPVVALDGRSFRISDPVLGRIGGGLVWQHDGQDVPLNPMGGWHKDDPASLVYQLDGMQPGRLYETRIELWGNSGPVTTPSTVVTFRETATMVAQSFRRDLSLRELTPGDYRIVIRVRDAESGAETVRERRLAVRP